MNPATAHPAPSALRSLGTALLFGLLATTHATAADEPPRFALSGFGTLGIVRSDKDNYRFHSSSTQTTNSPGQDWDASVDSVFGLQGTGRLDDRLDLTVQAISRQSAGHDHTPHVTWAYLRYRATPTLTLRAGRTTTPFFMFSDSLYVNYATPWLRPPVEVYSLNPFTNLDGVDLLYRIPVHDVDVEVQALYGKSAVETRSASGRLRDVRGVRVGLASSGFSAQAGYTRTTMALHWDDLAYQFLRQQLAAIGDTAAIAALSGDDSDAEFFSAGFQWERNNWITVAEFAKRRVDRYISSSHAWYVTVGRRFERLTPYVTYSQQHEDAPAFTARTSPSLDPLISLYNGTRATAQQTTAAGLRWDIARNIAIKSQIERVTPAAQATRGRGMFASDNVADYMKPATPATVVSLSLDFVF